MKHWHHTTPGKVYTGLLYYFLLGSCMNTIYPSHHFVYSPTGTNAPFLKEKNQIRISGNVTTVENDDHAKGTNIGMQVKTAYAITDHFGIAAAFFTGKEKDKYNQHSIYDDEAKSLSYRRKLGEISAGYFSSVNTPKNLFLELYAGYGLGRNIIKESYRQPYYRGGFFSNNYDLFFLQPGIALHHKNLFQVGIFLRTSLISFKNNSTTYTDDILMNKNVRLYELDKHSFIFFQPALSLRLPLSRKGNLNLNTEINGSFNLSAIPIYNRTAIVLMGITYSPCLKK